MFDDSLGLDISYVIVTPWTLYFDGWVCNKGQGIVILFVSPMNATFDFTSRLKEYCTNNQAEYEAFLFGLELLNCGSKACKSVWGFSASCPTNVGGVSMLRWYFELLSRKMLGHSLIF
jgi:ribonuclease HI